VSSPYPFSAVVGLADLRLSLLLNAVSPDIGGVLVRGEKGTAKSTVVRALAALLPPIDTVAGCRFACDPTTPDPQCPDGPHGAVAPTSGAVRRRPASLVELPVGATEDRLVGSLDLQRALTEGVKAYEPGLLAAAHRGVLYVDEVNLLPDHLVDLLLDAAAMGRAYVERDGVSVRHAARFLLVGTMNPEEGELRPQLLDRFGLAVDVTAPREAALRAEVVRRRLAYDADPGAFAARWAGDDRELAERIAGARRRLPHAELPDAELTRIAHVCAAFEVDGLRADIVVARAALALAAWHGRPAVTADDVRDAARLALPHRRRRDPFDAPGLDENKLDEVLRDATEHLKSDNIGATDDDPDPDGGPPSGSGGSAPDRDDASSGATPERGADGHGGPGAGPRAGSAADPPYRARLLAVPGTGTGTRQGRRSPAYTRNGRVVAARRPRDRLTTLHLPATVIAAAGRQAHAATVIAAAGRHAAGTSARGSQPGTQTRPVEVTAEDLREAVRKGREANLVLFAVDASGSMAARRRMGAVKAAVLSLLRDAYQRRDKVGLITFRGERAELALPPTTSHEIGAVRLRELPTGGRTPLAAGLTEAARVLDRERRRDPHRRPLLIIVTDGRATSGPDPLTVTRRLAGVATVVVDCESGPVRLGLAARLAAALDGQLMRLDDLSAETVRRAA